MNVIKRKKGEKNMWYLIACGIILVATVVNLVSVANKAKNMIDEKYPANKLKDGETPMSMLIGNWVRLVILCFIPIVNLVALYTAMVDYDRLVERTFHCCEEALESYVIENEKN